MLERLSSRHLTEWSLVFQIKAEEAEHGEEDDTASVFHGMGGHEAEDHEDEDDEDEAPD